MRSDRKVQKRLLIIVSGDVLTKEKPYNNIFQVHQAQVLSKYGFAVELLSFKVMSLKESFSRRAKKRVHLEGITIIRSEKRLFLPHRLRRPEKEAKRHIKVGLELFTEYVNDFGKPFIIHAHNTMYAGLLAREIKSNFGIEYFITEHHSGYARGWISNKLYPSIKAALLDSREIFAVSNQLKEDLVAKLEVGEKGVRLLPNLVTSSFANDYSYNDNQEFIFLSVGNLDENKNHKLIVHAFNRYLKGLPCYLKIGGQGPLLRSLKKLVEQLNLEKQIEFLGPLNRQDLCKWMNKAKCFVLSSDYETFGVVLIEALTYGLPIISTDSGGPKDIVKEENGVLVSSQDVDAFGKAMLSMYQSTDAYNSDTIRNRAISEFGEKRFISRYLEILSNN
ncbi:MAG: glycosyltransferase [Cyclobacteriaceae bacterium]